MTAASGSTSTTLLITHARLRGTRPILLVVQTRVDMVMVVLLMAAQAVPAIRPGLNHRKGNIKAGSLGRKVIREAVVLMQRRVAMRRRATKVIKRDPPKAQRLLGTTSSPSTSMPERPIARRFNMDLNRPDS